MTPPSRVPAEGEVWDVFLDPVLGREQGGRRPALVISTEDYNQTPNGLILVVPLTGTDRGLRIHLPLVPPEGGLAKRSVMMCDQMRAVSLPRFRRRRGSVTPATLDQVREMAGQFIGR